LGFGIGIHTGTVTTGGLGSERLETGTLGDAVNVAARLEQATRQVGVDVIISAETARDAGLEERLHRLEPLSLKGKSEPVEVFTLRVE
jgi:adenylate cyclase